MARLSADLAGQRGRLWRRSEFAPPMKTCVGSSGRTASPPVNSTGQFFGEILPVRAIDPRIRQALTRLEDFSETKLTAAGCAAAADLSPSRFLHLFKQETGILFRALRAWKRARHLLHFVNEDINLAHLAQDIGYPDLTDFSHSIRHFYGLKPRAIFSGSRDLAIYHGAAGL